MKIVKNENGTYDITGMERAVYACIGASLEQAVDVLTGAPDANFGEAFLRVITGQTYKDWVKAL